jgi:hypothetical protein
MPQSKGRPQPRPDEVLIRGIPKNKLDWDGQRGEVVPTLDNFMLRPIDTDGLTVDRIELTNYDVASQIKGGKPRFVGFVRITVGEVRALGLGVGLKGGTRWGAYITGLPPHTDVDAAEDWARILRTAFAWDRYPPPDVVEAVKSKHTPDA